VNISSKGHSPLLDLHIAMYLLFLHNCMLQAQYLQSLICNMLVILFKRLPCMSLNYHQENLVKSL